MPGLVRVLAILAGVLILLACTWAVIEAGQLTGAHVALVAALAFGTCIGAMVIARSSFLVGVWVAVAVLCGEGYGMLATAERIIAVRDASQAPTRQAEQERRVAEGHLRSAEAALVAAQTSPRLTAALQGKATAEKALVEKASERGCAENCRLLLQSAVSGAVVEINAARAELERGRTQLQGEVVKARERVAAIKMPAVTGTALAQRLGIAPWLLDLIAAGLLTVGANGLAAALIAWGAHGAAPRVITTAVTAPRGKVEDQHILDIGGVEAVGPSQMPARIDSNVIKLVRSEPQADKEPEQNQKLEPVKPTVAKAAVALPIGDFKEFIETSLEPAEDGLTEQSAIEAGYINWCRRMKREPIGIEAVRKGIERFCVAVAVERKRRGAEIYLLGVELRQVRVNSRAGG
jgi:hypothetical protein